MSKFRAITLFLVVIVLVIGIAPLAAQEEGEIETVCLVTDTGKVNDGSFNEYAYDGMEAAAEDFELETYFIETVSATDYEANIETCVNEGFDVVITVGYLITDATVAAAEENPDIYFIGIDQFIVDGPENMVGIQFQKQLLVVLNG